MGRRRREVTVPWRSAGEYRLDWDPIDDRGAPLGPGVYFVSLRSGSDLVTEKWVVIR